ncbi:hypothetical protein D1841_16835, partial [Neglecta sp. X4]|nr:hypothetical protein [Neglectibacter sp. X4]
PSPSSPLRRRVEVIYKLTLAGVLAGKGGFRGEMAGRGLNGGQDKECAGGALDGKRSVWICLQKLSGRNIQGKRRAPHIFKKKIFFSS